MLLVQVFFLHLKYRRFITVDMSCVGRKFETRIAVRHTQRFFALTFLSNIFVRTNVVIAPHSFDGRCDVIGTIFRPALET